MARSPLARLLRPRWVRPWLLASLVPACSGGGDGTDGTDGAGDDDDTLPTPTAEPTSSLALVDPWNATMTVSPQIPVYAVPERSDFTIDWSGLTTDVFGRPVDPSTWLSVLLSHQALTPAELAESVALRGPTPGESFETWGIEVAGRTSAPASALSHTGHAWNPDTGEAGNTYLVVLQDTDLKMVSVAIVTVGGADGTVLLGEGRVGTTLALAPQGPVTTSALGPWLVDWSGVTTTTWGDPFDPAAQETLFLARWDDAAEVDLLAPSTADGYWAKYVPGDVVIDPQTMNGFDGQPFPGFTPGPTWIVGFRCVNCATPAPLYATRVTVTE